MFPVQFQRIYGLLKFVCECQGLMNSQIGLLTEHINNVQPQRVGPPSYLLAV